MYGGSFKDEIQPSQKHDNIVGRNKLYINGFDEYNQIINNLDNNPDKLRIMTYNINSWNNNKAGRINYILLSNAFKLTKYFKIFGSCRYYSDTGGCT